MKIVSPLLIGFGFLESFGVLLLPPSSTCDGFSRILLIGLPLVFPETRLAAEPYFPVLVLGELGQWEFFLTSRTFLHPLNPTEMS